MQKEKTELMGVRLPEETIKKLELIGLQQDITKNQVAKKAIVNFTDITYYADKMEMITVPRELYAKMIEIMTNEQKKEYADIISDSIIEHFQYLPKSIYENGQSPIKINLDFFLGNMIKFIGNSGLKWFNHIEFETENEPFYFKGMHHLGEDWSLFFLITLGKILDKMEFGFKILEKSIKKEKTMVYLEFKKT
ncbi:MAG: hypothetical protein GY870_13700 [archaeon]|nr:hypothetical protein [archaeon]